ncbi:MAG TPA: transglutaminase-like domain-containing protein [Candidatus Binatia bacterium]
MSAHQDTVNLFVDLVSRADEDIHLPAAALAIARIAYPTLDMDLWLDELTALRHEARAAADAYTGSDPLEPVLDVVFEERGFDGDRENYYDPRNSFLSDVIERRRGIPITLAMVLLEAARGAGVRVVGIGFPGHFLVCHPQSQRYLDVFRKGLVLDRPGLLELLRRQGLGPDAWRDEFLAPVGRSQMLARMLNNLRRHYTQTGNEGALATVIAMSHGLELAREHSSAALVQ